MVKIPKTILIKIGKYFLITIGVLLIIFLGFYLWQSYSWKIGIDESCVTMEKQNIRGGSMEPLLSDNEQVKGLIGYYNCNEIKKGETAILEFKTREESFVKKIIGLPGDEMAFTEENELKLNGEILKNSNEEIYLFSEISQRILTIPLKDSKIPGGRYFVLSEEKGPTAFDSRQFGFVQTDHLKGRVIK